MIRFNRILCPTDLSTDSDAALAYAVALARVYEAKLVLLNCSQEKLVGNEESNPKVDEQINQLFRPSLTRYLGTVAQGELNWEGTVRTSVHDIGEAIVQEAARQDIDLIVMRSRRRPRAAVLLGSTAEAVCHRAPCPVLVTHPLEREWPGMSTGEIDLKRILIAHDFSRDSDAALNYGLSLAQEYQAEVHLLHVLVTAGHEEPELAWSSSRGGNAYTFTAQKLQHSLPKEVFLWCNFVNVVSCGRIHEEILAYARDQKIDLICLGKSDSDWSMGKLLGSNVDRVLREAPCPVLVAGCRDQQHG